MGTSFPHDWYIPPSSPGSGMHTWTGATVAPRHDEMTNGMNVEWEILQEKHRKTWKNHGENQGFLKMFHMNQAIHCNKVTRNARICKGNQV
jgi:hypothetical protein